MILDFYTTQIHYEVSGEGPALVLLHGLMEDLTMWDSFIPLLESKCKVIRLDLLGHGKTPCLNQIHSMELMAEAVYKVLDFYDIETVKIVGHSMGGYVALALADQYPTLVSEIVLLNSTFEADSEERKELRDEAIKKAQESQITFEKLIRLSFSNLFAPESKNRFEKEIKNAMAVALKMPLCGYMAALEGMKLRANRLEVLKGIRGKKIIIAGRKDTLIDLELLRHTAQSSKIDIIELSEGHMSHIENKYELSYFLKHLIEK